MATSKRAPENFYLDSSEDEEVYDKSDSTTIDDSYLAHLGERMSGSSPPPPAAASAAAKESIAKAPSLPPSFAPGFDEDVSNPLRVDPAPMNSAAGGSGDDIIELGDDALEPLSSEFEADPHPSQAPAAPGAELAPQGPSDLLRTVPPPPEELEPLDPELDPATYDAPTFVRPSLIEQDPVPVLEIIQGNEGGRSYRFEKDAITIGRSLDNDIVLTDIAVSRRHTRLTRQSNNVFLEDMGSGNGTIVNGVKVPRSPVASSDRIEVGNTILRVVFPGQDSFPPNAGAMDAAPPPQGGALHAKSTAFLADGNEVLDQIGVVQGQGQPMADPYQGMAAQGTPSSVEVQAQPTTPPPPRAAQPEPQPAARKSSPKSFKLAMAILAVGMLVIGCVAIIAAFIHVQNRGGGDGDLGSDGLFAQGTKAYTERRWGQAADSFERVLALAPTNTKAREYLNQSRAEERNQGTLEAARQAYEEENFEDAVTTLRTIPRSSVYSPQAIELRANAEERQARALVTEAQRLATDDPESARARVERALALAPSNTDALALRRQLAGGAPATPAPTATSPPATAPPAATNPPATGGARPVVRKTGPAVRRPSPGPTTRPKRASSGAVAGILSQYKSGNFAGAADRARELAASGSSDQERQRARSLSRQIDRFAKAYRGGQSGSNSRQKMRHLEQALRLDKQISGGHFAGKIRPTLRDVYVGNAQRAWRAGQYASACQSALRALKIDRSASGASQVSQRCESKAREFYQQGESAQGSNLTQAKSYYRKVLNMVPRSNPWYTKAYSALNNAGRRRSQDEDE